MPQITTAVFNSLPRSSQRMTDGKRRYSLISQLKNDGTSSRLTLYWYYDAYSNSGYAEIKDGSQIAHTYASAGATPNTMTDAEKEQIVEDYNAIYNRTQEERVEEETETVTTVRTETVNGCIITMKLHENVPSYVTFDTDKDRVYYEVSIEYPTTEMNGHTFTNNTDYEQSQEDAENKFEQFVQDAQTPYSVKEIVEYQGVTITYNLSKFPNGERAYINEYVTLTGEGFDETYSEGSKIQAQDMGTAENTQLGSLSTPLEPSVDTPILEERIRIVLNPTEVEQGLVLPDGNVEIKSWGFYLANSPTSQYSPFEVCDLRGVLTVSQTDGRILLVTDSDIYGIESGAVKLVVKQGYRVALRIMTQENNYFKDNFNNISVVESYEEKPSFLETTTGRDEVNYQDTEKVTLVLNGGDSVEIDIDAEVGGISTFSIVKNGSQLIRGSPSKIDNETFLAIVGVEKYSSVGGSAGGVTSPTEENDTPMSVGWVAIAVFGIIALGIMYMILAGEE